MPDDRLVSRSELKSRFGLNYDRVSLWRLEREGSFPLHVRLSKRRCAWVESEILDYIERLKANRTAAA